MHKKKSKLSRKIGTSRTDKMPLPKKNEETGKIIKLLGHDKMLVSLPDGNERIARIPGKYRGDVWLRANNFVIIKPLFPGNDDRVEIVYRYTWEEADYLINKKMLEDW
ncbi:MAG: S1 domain-containing protein [Candidatus Methanofastidiosia archaeon]